jgi:tRNA dimethylallyltransferase
VHDTRAVPRSDIIALFGPTAVGKTALALALADGLRELGEHPVAVSADALQVYQGLETLTGAPTQLEQTQLEHRLISLVDVGETFSAGRYAELAHAEIDRLLAESRRPILVGGTGLYLRAALTELSLRPPPAPGVRERWAAELKLRGPEALHGTLSRRAPEVAARIEPGDRQRVVRALELLDAGELTEREPESELWTDAVRHSTLLVGLVMERQALYARIEERVDEMLAAGAEDEVRQAAARGPSTTATKALGYAELLTGDREAMKRRTRQYARRQLTWMRKLSGVHVVDVTGRAPADVASEVLRLWLREAA